LVREEFALIYFEVRTIRAEEWTASLHSNTSGARAVEIGVQDLENIHGELKRLLADSFAARHL
jgi:hypothetical protein